MGRPGAGVRGSVRRPGPGRASALRRRALAAWVGLCCAGACDDDTGGAEPLPAGTFDLTDPTLWTRLPAATDPVERAPGVVCREDGYGAEQLGEVTVFSVDTEDCGHLTVVQPSLAAIAEGDRVELHVFHFRLSAPERAHGHVEVRVGDHVVFGEQVAIPADSGVERWSWTADRAFDAGATVLFHLHNHGLNSWSLVELRTSRDASP